MAATPNRTIQSIQVAGGNLFQIAAQYLGDATQWNRIARLNGLWDPVITGIVTLKIPPVDVTAGNGGILEI
jgi:nucleoid-associated protein YgaU